VSVARIKEFILIACFLVLTIPVHEFGHYIVAKVDGAQIYEFNSFIRYNGTHFIGPSIVVNEFTFSSFETLLLCNLAGFFITFIPGLIISVVLYARGSRFWYYSSTWVVSAPLVSLSDFDRILELLWLSDASKWVHVGLGAYMIFMFRFVRRKKEELINNRRLDLL